MHSCRAVTAKAGTADPAVNILCPVTGAVGPGDIFRCRSCQTLWIYGGPVAFPVLVSVTVVKVCHSIGNIPGALAFIVDQLMPVRTAGMHG